MQFVIFQVTCVDLKKLDNKLIINLINLLFNLVILIKY